MMNQLDDEHELSSNQNQIHTQTIDESTSTNCEIDLKTKIQIYDFDDEEPEDLNNLHTFKLHGTVNVDNRFEETCQENQTDFAIFSSDINESSVDECYETTVINKTNELDENSQLITSLDHFKNNQFHVTNYIELNDYVLYEIFDLLSLVELQQCRLVCKRWRCLIDTIRIKKLSLTYFSQHSWTSNDNYESLRQYSDSIDVASLNSFERILMKPQFRDLEYLILATEYASSLSNSDDCQVFELDISKFTKLKRLELSGNYVRLKDNQCSQTLTHLSIASVHINLMYTFPNLLHLKTNTFDLSTVYSNLKSLVFSGPKRFVWSDFSLFHHLVPNLEELSFSFSELLHVMSEIYELGDFPFNKHITIKVYFDYLLPCENVIQFLRYATKTNRHFEFHLTDKAMSTKGHLIKWFKLFEIFQIETIFCVKHKVVLRDFFLLPRYKNNTLEKQSLKVDDRSLDQIDDKIYQYLFNTTSLELEADHMEHKFNQLLHTIPCITKLIISHRLSQSTFDNFRFNCPYLSYLNIVASKQAYQLDLNFIHYLDHLTSIELNNIDIVNCSTIKNKIKFSKFLHILEFRSCRMKEDYSSLTKAMVEKAKKNPGKFYELKILPIQQVQITKFNEEFFGNSPKNFHTNLFAYHFH